MASSPNGDVNFLTFHASVSLTSVNPLESRAVEKSLKLLRLRKSRLILLLNYNTLDNQFKMFLWPHLFFTEFIQIE